MKTYRETYIRKAEIAQLILLHQVYMQRGSYGLIFQGGTAIRWCYGGSRFSEDLDFVTALSPETVESILKGAFRNAEKVMIPHFGVGSLTVTEKRAHTEAFKYIMDFRPEASREKISIKIEIEGFIKGSSPEYQNRILSTLPTVAYLIAAGDFRVPRPNAAIVVETPAEILSDKVRSLLERRYLKGRDMFDIWYLRTVLNAAVDFEIMERKFRMYQAPFNARRKIGFFSSPSEESRAEIRTAIEQDLARFLSPDAFSVHKAEGYAPFLNAVQLLFVELDEEGVNLS